MTDTPTDELTDEQTIALAIAYRDDLLSRACGPAQVEADLYRGPAPARVMHGIRGTNDWTPDAAAQFVADVRDAASPTIDNTWNKTVEAVDAPAQ